MDQKMTRDQRERAEGSSVAVFSIFITIMALFICVLVAVVTMRARHPAPGGDPSVSGTSDIDSGSDSNENPHPSGPSVPVFSPGAVAIRPYTTGNTRTVSDITSEYAVLVDAETGEIFAGKQADKQFEPASMTKVMTLLVACKRLNEADLDHRVEYTRDIRDYINQIGDASRHWGAGDEQWFGDQISVKDALYGIGVESAADCVMMVVCYLSGKSPAESEAEFVQWMNQEAADMGLVNTHFENATGAGSDAHKTTASDMAAIMIRALECPLISEILSFNDNEYRATMHYTKDTGEAASYWVYFHSTLFCRVADSGHSSRIKAYENQYGKFSLASLTFKGGKTGTLDYYSLASFAVDPVSGKVYVLITGDAPKSADVMRDAKTMYDTYAK